MYVSDFHLTVGFLSILCALKQIPKNHKALLKIYYENEEKEFSSSQCILPGS